MFAAAPLLAFALAAIPSANAFFRVACSGNTLVRERADPIVAPGVQSGHMHTIHGGSAFAPNYTYADARNSECTSCEVKSDLSNYWTPQLWFKDPATGKVEPVPNGGLLVYYQQRGDDKPNIKAFPPGFRMIAGNMKRRSKKFAQGEGSQAELQERATKWSCLRYTGGQTGYDGYGFPNTRCEAGFQARLHFPNCWDGKNLDSADHKSHVAYMSILDNGKCPETHPVSLMTMFGEVTWNTGVFDDRFDIEKDGWPFVYSHGDGSGHGFHGDFVNGWDVDALQQAITNCDNNTPGTAAGDARQCPHLVMQSKEDAAACSIKPHFDEVTTGVLDRLPGCNPITYEGEDATVYSEDNCPLDGGAAPAPVPEPSTTSPEPTSAPEVPSEEPEVPIPEPTTNIPEEPTTTEAPVEPTTTPAPEVPSPAPSVVTETVTQTVTVTANPECATTMSFRQPEFHRRSMVPRDYVQGRAPQRYQPRRR